MKRIYLSGPMTGEIDHGRPAFNAAAEKLRAAGYTVENPGEWGVGEMSWEAYLRRDIKVLVDCDAVATLPGWLASKGANLEVKLAQSLSIPVFPAEHWLAQSIDECLDPEPPVPPVMTLDDLRRHALGASERWFPAIHERPADFLIQSALGLAGETGEAVDVIKKAHRTREFAIDKTAFGAELADVFVYLLHLCSATGIDLEAEYLAKAAHNETRFGKSITQGG